jgi:Peptidase family M23
MVRRTTRLGVHGLVIWLAAIVMCACQPSSPASPPERIADVTITHLPSPMWTVTEGAYADPTANPPDGHANTQNLTWLLHLVLISKEGVPLSIEAVDVNFSRRGQVLWTEGYQREYLKRLEWIKGEFDMTSEYYITRVLHGKEEPGSPEIPANGALSWVRIPFARPWFARADNVEFRFHLKDGRNALTAKHTVALGSYEQKTTFQFPFSGTWAVNVGNDLSTGHRRSGLNGLTSYGWDFVKLGPNGMPYRTTGTAPEDFYTFGEPVLAAAAGEVVEVRNDIGPYGVGKAPSAEVLRGDGDIFAGNLVTLDHGNGEYTLTCHMLAGSVVVKLGEHVRAGQLLGKVGTSGFAGVPHIHFNLITGPKWLQAKGLPSWFSNFERIRTGAPPLRVERGDPVSGWLVRSAP